MAELAAHWRRDPADNPRGPLTRIPAGHAHPGSAGGGATLTICVTLPKQVYEEVCMNPSCVVAGFKQDLHSRRTCWKADTYFFTACQPRTRMNSALLA